MSSFKGMSRDACFHGKYQCLIPFHCLAYSRHDMSNLGWFDRMHFRKKKLRKLLATCRNGPGWCSHALKPGHEQNTFANFNLLVLLRYHWCHRLRQSITQDFPLFANFVETCLWEIRLNLSKYLGFPSTLSNSFLSHFFSSFFKWQIATFLGHFPLLHPSFCPPSAYLKTLHRLASIYIYIHTLHYITLH